MRNPVLPVKPTSSQWSLSNTMSSSAHYSLLSTLVYLLLLTFVAAFVGAQGNYGYGQVGYPTGVSYCDRSAYDRASNFLRLELQNRNVQSNPPYSAYSGMTNGYQPSSVTEDSCRNFRQSFNDLFAYTPICESINSYQHQNSAQMLQQSRNFMRTNCDRFESHQTIQCYKVSEIYNCEQQFAHARQSHTQSQPVMHSSVYGNTYGSPYNTGSGYNYSSGTFPVSPMLCGAYEMFRNCSLNALQRNCYKTQVSDHVSGYLMDHGRNLAYSCLPGNAPYPAPNQPPMVHSGMMNPGFNNTAYNPIYPRTDVVGYPPPASPYQPTVYSSGFSGRSSDDGLNRMDSLGSDSLINSCIQTVKPFEGACTDLMIERQRDARHGRSSNDVQRRICCALFQYRDCLSRTVLERCPGGGTTRVVDYLMGPRQQELSANCRDYTREQCSGTIRNATFSALFATILLLLNLKYFH